MIYSPRFAVTRLAGCTLLPLLMGTLLTGPVAAQTEGTVPETTESLNLTLDTGATTATTKPTTPVRRKSTPTATRTKGRTTSLPLPSRSGSRTLRQQPVEAPKVLAQLGFVNQEAELRVSVDPTSQLMSRVPQGTHVAVVAEAGEYWGVLMVNKTIGWTPKSNVELLDYQTQVALPPTLEPAEPTPDPETYTGNSAEMLPQIQTVLREAFTYLGVPYVWGGNTRSGLDCSAFVRACFRTQGISLPRHSGDQITQGRAIYNASALKAGDRLYFDCSTRRAGIDHTGIYLGNGYFIHASGSNGKVVVESLLKATYIKNLVAIRRDFE